MGNFYTDTLCKSKLFNSNGVVRDVAMLYPPFKEKILNVLSLAKAAGLRVVVFETYRSQARQQTLFKRGATRLKTNGMHHYGVACDIVFLDEKGNPTWTEQERGDWAKLGKIIKSQGLVWGGDWPRFTDKPHAQMPKVQEQPSVVSGKWFEKKG